MARDLVRGLGGDAVLLFLGRRTPDVVEAEGRQKWKLEQIVRSE